MGADLPTQATADQSRSSSGTITGAPVLSGDGNTVTLTLKPGGADGHQQLTLDPNSAGQQFTLNLQGLPLAIRRRESHMSIGPGHARDASHGATVISAGGPSGASGEAHGGHDAPNWSRAKSASVLLACTVLYAAIAGAPCSRGGTGSG
jgi:hypothetical protein